MKRGRRPRKIKAPESGVVFRTRSEHGTFERARRFGRSLRGDEVILLIGELGAGKTVFAKGVASGLGVKDAGDVCSPSFTLMNVYRGRVPIYHLDLFRLDHAPEIRDLGFEDVIGDGVILIEWAEKIDFSLSAFRVTIEVEGPTRRTIRILPPRRRAV